MTHRRPRSSDVPPAVVLHSEKLALFTLWIYISLCQWMLLIFGENCFIHAKTLIFFKSTTVSPPSWIFEIVFIEAIDIGWCQVYDVEM